MLLQEPDVTLARCRGTSWQNDLQIDDGKQPGFAFASAVCIVVLLVTAASYFYHNKNDVQALSNTARIIAMKIASN